MHHLQTDMSTDRATTLNGQTVTFFTEIIGEGLMKRVYLCSDRSSVICFFRDQSDSQRLARLKAVVEKYNPTRDPQTGAYWKELYCWPTDIARSPKHGLGVIVPRYPQNFIFANGPWKGREKKGAWFFGRTGGGTPFRDMMPASERGDWLTFLKITIQLARAVRRLHMAGLAHSDLSSNNVLVDPVAGRATVIDIDALVVPGIFPPDVAGSPGYIAPEVLATIHLPRNDPRRNVPNIRTDQHALAVLIYQYLLFRHPLYGPRALAAAPDEDEIQSMGTHALFIEHPTDHANRLRTRITPYAVLGPSLARLIETAFISGLHAPHARPAASDWERALMKTYDAVLPCDNAKCGGGWFPLADTKRIVCPWCGTKYTRAVPVLTLCSERKRGQWLPDSQIVVYDQRCLFKWHAFINARAGEHADRTPHAYCRYHEGKWLLINERLGSLTSVAGSVVRPGQAVELTHGAQFRLSQDADGRMAEVRVHDP